MIYLRTLVLGVEEMEDSKGLYITNCENGYYWYMDFMYGLDLIKIDDNEAYFYGDEVGFRLSQCNGKIIEKIKEPNGRRK